MILPDTNVVSALMRRGSSPSLVRWLNTLDQASVWTTAITVFEIEYGLALMPAGNRARLLRAEWEAVLAGDLQNRVAPFDQEASRRAGEFMARRESQGRRGEWRDTQIAGIALVCGATLATGNSRHFDDAGAPIIDPFNPA